MGKVIIKNIIKNIKFIIPITIVSILFILIILNWEWFNLNSGGVQVVATLMLVGVTGIYVIFVYRTLQEQRRLREKERYQQIVDYIIFPILEILSYNLKRLEERNIGFKKDNKTTFTRIKQIEDEAIRIKYLLEDIDIKSGILFEDFLNEFPEISEEIENYNNRIYELEEIVNEYAQEIFFLEEFRKEVIKKWEEYWRGKEAEKERSNEEKLIWEVVVCIINNFQEASENKYKHFCNRYRTQLLEIINHNKLREKKEKFENFLDDLEVNTCRLWNKIYEIRGKLSKEYGLKLPVKKKRTIY